MKALLLILALGTNPGEVIEYNTVPVKTLKECHELRHVARLIVAFSGERLAFYCIPGGKL